ncbi:MAG: flagellar basal body P-ring formation chaperone FlgA [Tistlia sp.]|uniref:flagellar basal body P-ring formation chaperone FlgA n=1 Tax=Tistlia sp. TaxID=3057121 RepID=UPI0034A4D6AB
MLRLTRSAAPLALAFGCALAFAAGAPSAVAESGTTGPAAAGQTALAPALGSIQLRQPALITEAVVTLGDLFAGLSAEQAETPVARGPSLGDSTPVDAAWLARLAKHYRVDWEPRSHLDGTVVEHAAIRIGAGDIEPAVERLFAEQNDGRHLEISLDKTTISIALPLESEGRFGLEGLRQDQRSGRFSVTLVYPDDGSPTIRAPLSGRVLELVEVPVLLRRVGAGEILGVGDIGWEMRPADRVSANLLTDPAQMIGQSPTRGLRAGDPVRAGDLQAPVLVPRNAPVTLRYRSAGMTLTAQGRSLDEGGAGSLVRVVNLKSNTIVQAVVTQAGVVDVATGQF